MENYFQYGEKELAYLKKADNRLAEIIEKYGFIQRKVYPDFFGALVNTIIGQQISSKTQEAIWNRLASTLRDVTPSEILSISADELKSFGMTYKKAGYIQQAATKIIKHEFELERLYRLNDKEACHYLTQLAGIGQWSAEMLLLFSLQRTDILSYGDFGIKRGLCRIYGLEKIDKRQFSFYQQRFSPYNSIASFYLWAVSAEKNFA